MSRLPDSLRSGFGTSNPPGNGYSDSKYTSSARGDEDRSVRPPPFRSRERRAGQYGAVTGGYTGFNSNPPEEAWAEETPQVERPTSLERTQAKRRSGNVPYAQRNPRRSTGQNGDGSRQIEAVIESIKQDWGFMTEEKCIPVQVALQFMDTSSLGLASRYSRFQELHMQLQSALRAIVNEHHQGFNSSIGTFHSIQSALQASQQRLRALKESLGQANGNLSTTKSELKGLATSSQNYDDMLMILSSM
jgi:exocyst complex component 4